jgi:hypothetical protein
MSLLQHPGAIPPGATGYEAGNSIMLDRTRSEFLKSSNSYGGTAATNNKKGTISFWVKRAELGLDRSGYDMHIVSGSNSARTSGIYFGLDDKLKSNFAAFAAHGGSVTDFVTSRVFRDVAAWYHIVLRIDSTDGTADNRIRVYVNGTQETTFDTAPALSQNAGPLSLFRIGAPGSQGWGTIRSSNDTSGTFSGYFSEIHYIDGQSLGPTEFGETNDDGVWVAKEYTGTYGNVGYKLDFTNASNIGQDVGSTHGNLFTLGTGLDTNDVFLDSPTNNFAVWDFHTGYLNSSPSATGFTAGNLLRQGGNGGYNQCYATMGISKASSDAIWYWEVENTGNFNTSTMEILVGVVKESQLAAGSSHTDIRNSGVAEFASNLIPSFSQNSHANTVFGMLLDMSTSNVKLKFYVNDSLVKTTENLPTDELFFPYGAIFGTGGEMIINCGQGPAQEINSGYSAQSDAGGVGSFEFTTKSGRAICTKNLAEYG